MALKQNSYKNIRSKMKPGDVIAFSGKRPHSETIKIFTDSNVSHVGVIFQSKLSIAGDPKKRSFNLVAEATASGVRFTGLRGIKKLYDGELWWLPLSNASRQNLKLKKFFDFLLCSEGKPYDFKQAIGAGVDVLDDLGIKRNEEDFEKLFCSELVAGALEKGGVIADINASEVTPIDLCRFNIYCNNYVQFKGEKKSISGFNSSDPAKWQ